MNQGCCLLLPQVNPSLNSELLSSGIVSLLVNIASRGTAFSGQWILRDLEVNTK